jgi:dienelactone hydrolase
MFLDTVKPIMVNLLKTQAKASMTRRELIHSVLLLGIPGSVTAQTSSRSIPFPGTGFRAYSRCLPDHLTQLSGEAFRRRELALGRLISSSSISARQAWIRKTLWNLIGGQPERTPLNARVTGGFDRTGYRVQKVVYESQPNFFITANLYVPAHGDGPFPAVLFQSGHYWEGKAYPSYQRCCQGLVQLGFAVLAFEPMGQGERIHYLDASGLRSRLPSCDAEHTTPGKQLLLFGGTVTQFQLWDAMRSLDYLLSLPIVDPKRVASVGHSGGGTLTMLLAAADERLAAAAVSMGNAENVATSTFRSPGAADDAEQNFVGSGPAGFDRWDLFHAFAPKPMLFWPSDRDFLATYSSEYIQNGWEEYQKLKAVYERENHSDHLAWADTPLPHALTYDSRLLVYNWFTRWLKPGSAHVREEPPVTPEPVSQLWATDSGSVVRSLNSTTPFALNLNRSRQVRRTSASLEKLLSVTRPAAEISAKRIGQVQSRNIRVEIIEVHSAREVWLPAFLLAGAEAPRNGPVLLVLDENQSDRLWFDPEVDRIIPDTSPIICAADIRGIGVLAPEFSPGVPGYAAWHQQEENYAWGSLILGESLLGQRITDILALVAALQKYPVTAGMPIHLAALGELTVPALFAPALAPEIQRLYLAGGLVSFQNVVETEIYTHPFANFVPGLLNHTDLPDVAASLAPRRVTLAGSVDATGSRVSPDTVGAIYSAARQNGNLTIVETPDWSAESLIARLSTPR